MSRHSKPSRPQTKKSFSTVISSAHVETGGDPRFYRSLVKAFKAPFKDKITAKSLTHPFHSYPARMHPATSKNLLEMAFTIGKVEKKSVLDPFVGSGTTMVEAIAGGYQAYGVDLNPLAVMLASVKSSPRTKAYRKELKSLGTKIANEALEEGKAARRSGYKQPAAFAPQQLSKKKREEILKGWFARHVRAELEFMASLITGLNCSDPRLNDALKVSLSSVVIKASSRASDSDDKVVAKNIARGAPARWFKSRIDLLWQGLQDLSGSKRQESHVMLSNAVDLSCLGLAEESVGVVCTSPPYIGTYDYASHHDLRAALLGLPLEGFAEGEFGARRDFEKNSAKSFEKAKKDMKAVFANLERLCVPGGLVLCVMGDSVAGNQLVLADAFLDEVKGHFEKVAWAWQPRKKWGLKEQKIFGTQVKREHILVFRKSK